ncbi:alpha/beta fold hydrolase [Ensifer sp. Root1252]|uniref:alpha/beta fold hydrolase n=1 Tax=Ensifer TaxID=106591 RepID=UPI0030F36CE8
MTGLIIQNGDIYEDVMGPKYAALKSWWADRTTETHRVLEDAVSEAGFRAEFVGEVSAEVAARVPPDLWKLHWPLMNTPERRRISVRLIEIWEENFTWFPRYQAYLRQNQPSTLIVWGPEDGYMPAQSARAYLRDLPNAQLHLIAGAGHWLLETHFDEARVLVREFLSRLSA